MRLIQLGKNSRTTLGGGEQYLHTDIMKVLREKELIVESLEESKKFFESSPV